MSASPTASVTNANGSQKERRNYNHLFLLPPESRGNESFDKVNEDLTGWEIEKGKIKFTHWTHLSK